MKAGHPKGAGIRALCLLLIAFLPILPGCWDRKELNEIALIRAAGFDRTEEGQIEVTILQILPQRVGDGGSAGHRQMVLSAQGTTIPEAKDKLQQKMGRRLFTGHQEVVLLGKRLAKTGIRDVMDTLVRIPDIRTDALLFVSEDPPREIFETMMPAEPPSTATLYRMVKMERKKDVTIMRVLKEMSGEEEATTLPVVRKVKDAKLGLNGEAVFRGDRMVGHLGRETKEGLLWIRNEFTSRVINTCPKGERGHVSLEVLRVETDLIPRIEGEKRGILLKAITEDEVVFNGTHRSLYQPSNVDRIAREMERDIRDRLRRTVKRAQKARADVLGFAGAFHRKYPEEWARMKHHWNERVFPRLEVDIQVRVHIRRPGMIDQSAGLSGENKR